MPGHVSHTELCCRGEGPHVVHVHLGHGEVAQTSGVVLGTDEPEPLGGSGTRGHELRSVRSELPCCCTRYSTPWAPPDAQF